ncbi:MAG: hypothetical protein RLY31_674 [Bacteroidota bacterium]|jgi:hypothetical protein
MPTAATVVSSRTSPATGKVRFSLGEENPYKQTGVIANLVDSRLPTAYRFDSLDDIQVLVPMKRGVIGN